MNFEEFKYQRYRTWSDIIEHLPILENFAKQCDYVTEFGMRHGCSTAAFIAGAKKKVTSYDINITDTLDEILSMELPCQWEFVQASTSDPHVTIGETDFLFIDTLHTYRQVEAELRLHGHKARKWIGFHDIESQGTVSVDVPGEEGINRAIKEYMEKTGCWKTIYEVYNNNGLQIIERI